MRSWRGWGCSDGNNVLMRRDTRDPESFLPPGPYNICLAPLDSHGHTVRWQQPGNQEKGPQNEILFASTLILDFPLSKTLRNKLLLLKPSACGPLWWQPELRQRPTHLQKWGERAGTVKTAGQSQGEGYPTLFALPLPRKGDNCPWGSSFSDLKKQQKRKFPYHFAPL